MAVFFDDRKNFGYSVVTTAPTPATSGTSLVVNDGTVYPTVPFNAVVWPAGQQPTVDNAEIIRVTLVSTNTLTITRAQEGTVARTIVVGDQISNNITIKALDDIETYIAGSFALTDGATPALNANTGLIFTLTSTTNPTIAVPTNPTNWQRIIIAFKASGGARTLSLNTGAGGFRFGSDISGLTSTSSGKTDYVGAIFNPTDSFWDVIAYVKGF